MRTKKISVLVVFIGLLLFTGCQSNKDAEEGEAVDSTKYSGEKFRKHVRSTEARTPEEERAGFKLPPGFEIELYASEPDIGKPININFDDKGRMWVTQSYEYPFPASPGKGNDHITILEDTNQDGKADRFTQFADTLNIPLGILPLNDGAIAYSIPNVYRFTDTDGDGKADHKKTLFGPFEHKDTHGMVNNFIRGYDGWIHACHGFTNQSTIAGADGDSITMISGNTFRFRPDGSRVEHVTHGRINPFGLAYDELGYLYSTDCHTSPLYQLIRGGDYMQWGKEEEMGFAPDMKPMEDESTALAGIAYYADVKFPEEYQSNFYIGDVVASRVYRNSFEFKGSTPVGKREADFVLSEDPWFRPVNVKLGPDGALYIADFYNSIIGHYEVPLDHPKRDKIRGRIWRITYKGNDHETEDWTSASVEALVAALDRDNLAVRMTAADQLADRIGQPAIAPLEALINQEGISTRAYIHSLWVLQRLNALTDDMIRKSASHEDPVIRLHTMRVLAEMEHDDHTSYYPLITTALQDKDPHVRRAAVELLVKYPDLNSLESALSIRAEIPDYDTHLIYTTRLCLRNLLRNDPLMQQVASREWDQEDAEYLADVMLGVPSPEAGIFLARYIDKISTEGEEMSRLYQHMARYIPKEQLAGVINTAMEKDAGDIDSEYLIFKGIHAGIAQRGGKETSRFQQWGRALAQDLLKQYPPGNASGSEDTLARQLFAIELAGNYKVQSLEPVLMNLIQQDSTPNLDVKTSALRSLVKIAPEKKAALAASILQDEAAPLDLKIRVANLLGDVPGPAVNKVLGEVKNAPPNLQEAIVMSLASSPEGKNIIFRQVREGEIFPRTLIEPKVEERILLSITPEQQKEFEELTAELEPVSKEKQTLIFTRLAAFRDDKPSPSSLDSGQLVFQQHCATCHQIGNQGGMIGPQLDGVGKWGANALAEKILDPNRNISEAFRNYTIKLKNGKVMSGLYRRDEGEMIVFADAAGKEFSVPKKDIAEQKASKYTLMPDHFGDVLSQQEFNTLLSYLLSLQS